MIWVLLLLGASLIGTLGTRLMPIKKDPKMPYIKSFMAKYYLDRTDYRESELPMHKQLAIYVPNTLFCVAYIATATTMFGRAFADRYFRSIYAAIRGLYLGVNDAASHGWAVVTIVFVVAVTALAMAGLIWFGTYATSQSIQERCKEQGFVVTVYSRRGIVSVYRFVASSIVEGVDRVQVKLRHFVRVRIIEKR